MSSIDMRGDHPIDALPDYVRGAATETDALERHLAQCESCRVELEVVRALHESGPTPLSDLERQRVYRAFDVQRMETAAGGPRWLRTTWRAAATIALLLTGVGVWQFVQNGEAATDWSPELALEGWSDDLADLNIGLGAVQLAFGVGTENEIPWDDLEGVDPFDLATPWEDN